MGSPSQFTSGPTFEVQCTKLFVLFISCVFRLNEPKTLYSAGPVLTALFELQRISFLLSTNMLMQFMRVHTAAYNSQKLYVIDFQIVLSIKGVLCDDHSIFSSEKYTPRI